MDTCNVEGCNRPVNARGMCSTHYMRQRRAGLLPVVNQKHAPFEERFWRFVQKSDGCWLWKSSFTVKGYGKLGGGGRGGKQLLAHRVSYEIHHGEIPDGMVVMHKCDNPACVNPDHLQVGTQSENILDSLSKGRKVCVAPVHQGEQHWSAKLTEDDVRAIRESKGIPYTELAKQYGVYPSVIRRAAVGETWKHVK